VTITGLILSVLPFIILSVFSHPCWDDFEFSELTRELGFLEAQRNWYYTWTGRFFSTAFLSSVNPLVYRSITGYKILMMFFLILFIISIYMLISEIISDKITKKQKLIICLAFCFLYFTGMPSMKLGFFWLSTAVIYQLANIMTVFIILLIIKSEKTDSNESSLRKNILIYLLIFAVCGSNEVSMVILMLLLFLIYLLNYIAFKKFSARLFSYIIASFIAFFIVFISPGNVQRYGKQPNSHNLLYSIKNTFIDMAGLFFYKYMSIPFIAITVLFILVLIRSNLSCKFTGRIFPVNPLYTVSAYLLIISAGYFTSYWSLGILPYERTANVIYFAYLLGWFFNILIVINYVKSKYNFNLKKIPVYVYACLIAAIFFTLIITNNSIRKSYRGTAVDFNSELNERYRFIKEDKADTCVVKSILTVPGTLFYHDITDDPMNKYNVLEAEYFNKLFLIAKDSVKSGN
jgi:hypothetical protein